MPDAPKPVTLGDLFVETDPSIFQESLRPATVADLLSPEIRSLVIDGLRAEGVLVVEKDPDGEWPDWAYDGAGKRLQFVGGTEQWKETSYRMAYLSVVLRGLAEAQPFPPAGG